jgi:hypothetical protein
MREEFDIPVRSQSGMAALDIFYSDFNDVNFYVEDDSQENLYYEVFRKLFKEARIARIFPLGGKCQVFAHATAESNKIITCFRVYVVDRDFDFLLGNEFEHPNVFYLDRFCIENHLIEMEALIEVVIENYPKKKRDQVGAGLQLDKRMDGIFKSLRPLFTIFLCAQSLDLSIRNCSSPPEAFCEPKRLWDLSARALKDYEGAVKREAEQNDPKLFDSQMELMSSRASSASDDELVSGKFVAAMLFHYIKSKYSLGSMTFDSFVFRLAKNCTLQSMRTFADRVVARKRADEGTSRRGRGKPNAS